MFSGAVLFAAAWPLALSRLDRMLVCWRLDAADREDLIQETAARVMASGRSFDSADALVGYAITVARNLANDRWRCRQRVLFEPLPDDEPGLLTDVATHVEQRLDVAAVWSVWPDLSATEQAALRAKMFGHEPWSRLEQIRWGVRTHRARVRLRELLDGAIAVVTLGRIRLRLLAHRAGAPAALAAATVLAPMGPALLPGPPGTGPSSSSTTVREVPRPHATEVARLGGPHDRVDGAHREPVDRPRQFNVSPPAARASAPASAPAPSPSAPPLVSFVTPTGDDMPRGGATDDDDRALEVCVTDMPVLGSSCPVYIEPFGAVS